jgi:hypothetical protein
MSRSVGVRLLAGLVLAGCAVALLATWWKNSTADRAPLMPAADLAAPLPEEHQADFAAALPEIDELRLERGSLLDGSLLDSLSAPERPREDSYVDLLRREARRLDSLAADAEDTGQYASADSRRAEAHELRLKARDVEEPLVQFGSHSLNR